MRIWDFTFPGTHNSGSYKSSKKGFVRDFILCQKYDIATQLGMGARFLDIRLLPSEEEQCIWVSHGTYNYTVRSTTADTRVSKTGENPNIFALNMADIDCLLEYHLGDWIGDMLSEHTTVEDLIKSNQRCILFFQEKERYKVKRWDEVQDWNDQGPIRPLMRAPTLPTPVASADPPRGVKCTVLTLNSLNKNEDHPYNVDLDFAKQKSMCSRSYPSKTNQELTDIYLAGLRGIHHTVAKTDPLMTNSEPIIGKLRIGLPIAYFLRGKKKSKYKILESLEFNDTDHSCTFTSSLATGRSRILKSWHFTRETDPVTLLMKLRTWSRVHCQDPPRIPYVFKVLACEITAPHPQEVADASSKTIIGWWMTHFVRYVFESSDKEKGNMLLASKTNELLLEHMETYRLYRGNVITHDFCERKICKAILDFNYDEQLDENIVDEENSNIRENY